ncbi:hypothetical protein VFPPC_00597 [Pochonia chlamydosporia 170]|uniref:Uncharacterized protein n=1 Tax=Pochonia chlamydosporia 170 TaxID=1380566 RepID=A0A179G4B6_METCM|nr:hypothetical protein VFPPC_00597 [Pochonia chlamydosporia 170]OAQ72692.1 hypothetical protein VFPPC_00597 [Pochonia chlamydosporia 170]
MRISNTVFALGVIHSVHGSPVGARDEEMAAAKAPPKIISGLYGTGSALAAVVVHDTNGKESWRWTSNDAQNQGIPGDLLACIKRNYAVPEVKWANGGKSILTIFNGAALMINYLPGNAQDKKIKFGTCVNRGDLGNTHSLELVPNNKIAIATTSDRLDGNIQVFDIGRGLQAFGNPVEKLDRIPGVHGLVWDKQSNMLWASGSDLAPNGKQPSASTLNAYAYNNGRFQAKPVHEFKVSAPIKLTTEWANTQYSGWWDGGHDLTPVPNQRKLLISTDVDVHVFDIPSKKFEHGDAVVKKHLQGFQPVDKRVGSNGQSLPRSDIKCLSLDGSGNAIYIQAKWKDVTSHQINWLSGGKLQKAQRYAQEVYRSRWFQGIPGWPAATSN